MFRSLFRKSRPMETDDAFFGRLVYMRIPGERRDYWEGRRVFAPLGVEIELFIDAPEPRQPPNAEQREFFTELERNFGRLIEAVEPVLRKEFRDWTGQALAGPLIEEFMFEAASIPPVPLETAEWEMSFGSKTNPDALFSVTLNGMQPTASRIDD